MGENKQPKVMKNNQPISTKAKDKKVFVKKTCNDFLKDGCISSLQKPPQKDGGGRVDSDDVPSGSNKQSELKGSKEEVAVSKDQGESAPSPSALQTPSVQEAENEMEITVGNEVTEALSRLLLGKSTNRQMMAWIESNLDKRQRESAQFVRALVTSVCQAAISATSGSVHHVNACDLMERSEVLRKYLSDGQKELEALHALEDLLERMERPHKVLHLLFDVLFDEGIIKEDTFHECKGAAEQSGRGLVLKSVTDFFDWLSK
ncbi:eukaryotic translation initiation factor 4 gamma 3-like isoform X2 [Takifugu rubripes]|uniref:eukaryotic translation initiation factor 4 gamma 3-like isoform X2 n=1 Tax=Takifugu rubripes TaxID=31033 RepID=UPI0011452A83|nr:eukaryotic translation initiation factor 4 gamma 3-like isoform X2 [Takifugu rubripes]